MRALEIEVGLGFPKLAALDPEPPLTSLEIFKSRS